jgi:hypothetical protein
MVLVFVVITKLNSLTKALLNSTDKLLEQADNMLVEELKFKEYAEKLNAATIAFQKEWAETNRIVGCNR